MRWKTIVGIGMKLPELQAHIDGLKFDTWRPSFMVLHNTGAPTLAQWHSLDAADDRSHTLHGGQRIQNLVSYFRDQRGWPSGPHAFVADDLVWPFTPFTTTGTHSPSWNGLSLGIEMVADFDSEDPEHGAGALVIRNTVALFAMLHRKLGLDPDTIKLHKEDRLTTHACPGQRIVKADFIQAVKEYMGHGGDYHGAPITIDELQSHSAPGYHTGFVAPRILGYGRVLIDGLNMRDQPSARGTVVSLLSKGRRVAIFGDAMNGKTKWLSVQVAENNLPRAWVASKYIEWEKP